MPTISITAINSSSPNWVAWVLTKERAKASLDKKIWYDDFGKAVGIDDFAADRVKGTYIFDSDIDGPRPDFSDWDELPDGMSHGHPAADCKTSKAAMNQSFLLTNMCVQAEKLNSGSWNRLEMKCRDLAEKYGCIYIVTGPVFNNGKISATMGKNKVAIPDAFFKVILCLNGEPKAIGFVYENNNEKHNMEDAVRTIDAVEQLTGIDFFPLLPNEVEDNIESHANLNDWH